MTFSCYSYNENMQICTQHCQFCTRHYHSLPKITKYYETKVKSNTLTNEIIVIVPNDLLLKIKELKKQDRHSLRNALVELLIDKI